MENILLDILAPSEEFYEVSAQALEESASSGPLTICIENCFPP